MRFWITRNSELAIHEQLVRQVLLGIMSQELPPGRKLPSVRSLARRYDIHPNTVSAAYHELLQRGWLELKRGSGLFVRPMLPQVEGGEIDQLVAEILQKARLQGFEPEEILNRLSQIVRPRVFKTILVADTEPEMRDILQAEISAQIPVEVGPFDPAVTATTEHAAIVALAARLPALRGALPQGVMCIPLRLRSVRGSLEEHRRPEPNALVSIVSHSFEIRIWARAMLLAVGLNPLCLCEIDTSTDGWQDRMGLSQLVVTDILTARQLPDPHTARIFRVISDESLADLKRVCVP